MTGALALGALSMAPAEREAPGWRWMPMAVAVLMAAPIMLTWEQAASDKGAGSALPQTVLTIGILAASALGVALSRGSLQEPTRRPAGRAASVRMPAWKAAESAARVTEARVPAERDDLLRAIAILAPAGIYVTNSRGECLFVNEHWCGLSGLSSDEASGDGWRRSLHPDDRDRVLRLWEARAGDRRAFDAEYRFLAADRQVTWVEDRATPLTQDDGRLSGYVGVVVDIGARRKAERAADDRGASWRLAIEAQRIGVFEWDLETDALVWSPRVHELLGFDLPASFHTLAHSDDRARLERAMTAHLATGAPLRLALRLRREKGDFGHYLFAGQAARDNRGRPSRLYGSLLEVTEDLLAERGAQGAQGAP